MRNTGSHISNNTYHSNEIRGGEKKVMKKSLSVILSTTMALSAFSTAALAATSKDFSDLDKLSAADKVIFDKLIEDGIFLGVGEGKFGVDEAMKRDQFAVAIVKAFGLTADATTSTFPDVKEDAPELRFIEAAYKAGIANGNKDGTFNPKGEVSVQELAVFLVGALGPKYKEEARAATGNHEGVAPWAQGYVTTALKYNLLAVDVEEGFDGFAAATRYQLAKGVAAAQAKYAEDNKPPYATKVEGVTSTNLKEIEVKFDGGVDKNSAEDADKYSVNNGITIDSAQLLEDGNTVRLVVKDNLNGQPLENQKVYKLSVNNVKSANGTYVSANDISFASIDNTLPEVVTVRSLGTKAVKVTFNKPVKRASSTNFKLDGKTYFGNVNGEGTRDLILKPYNSGDLSVGNHKLEVSSVEDYRGFKALSKEFEFEVVEDTVAPKVDSVAATFERVTITFSEEVDPDTVSASNVYWKSGSDKKSAGSVKQISPEVFEFDFTNNPLPGYELALYVEGVKDYSGNVITETEVRVRAEVDQTRPEVTEAAIDKTTNTQINIKFNKQVEINDIKYFTLTKSNGDVVPLRNVVGTNGSTKDKVFHLTTYDALTEEYTLKIVGVRDTTKLNNVMEDYTVKLSGKDNVAPKYVTNSGNGRVLVIEFNKKMDLATLADPRNYLVTINTVSQLLPDGTEVIPQQDGKAVRIIFPEYIDQKRVGINDNNAGADITAFTLVGVRDTAGNPVNILGVATPIISAAPQLAAYESGVAEHARLTEKGVIKVRFDQPIGKANINDFVLSGPGAVGVSISEVKPDGTAFVTIKLAGAVNKTGLYNTDLLPISISVNATNGIETTTGIKYAQSGDPINVKDKVKPVIDLGSATRLTVTGGDTILLPFSEPLADTSDGINEADYRNDLVLKDNKTGDLIDVNKYQTSVNGNVLQIQLTGFYTTNEIRVSLSNNLAFIKDKDGNVAAANSNVYLTQVGQINNPQPVTPAQPQATIAQGTNPGSVLISNVNNTMEYELIPAGGTATGNFTQVPGTTFELPANIGDQIVIQVAPNGVNPASPAQTINVTAANIKAAVAPNVASAAAVSGTAGLTDLSGLSVGVEYEYVLNNLATLSAGDSAWTNATSLTPTTASIEDFDPSGSQYLHIRVKQTAQQPASEIQSVQLVVAQ